MKPILWFLLGMLLTIPVIILIEWLFKPKSGSR